MSTLIAVTRKPVTVQGYQLTSGDDMYNALKYIAPAGYFGGVSIDTSGKWMLSFQNNTQTKNHTGVVGDWVIIENNAVVSVCPASQFASLYQP